MEQHGSKQKAGYSFRLLMLQHVPHITARPLCRHWFLILLE
jgi:hypothetical protein